MPSEERPGGGTHENTTEEYSFDELAKGLASNALSRERALKLLGATLLGSLLGAVFSTPPAEAKRRRHRRRRLLALLPPPVVSPPPPGEPCSAANCPNGCCLNNQCHTNDPHACGTGGGACTECGPAAVSCPNGTCTSTAPPPVDCNASTRPNGCCLNGVCHVHDPQACGTNGSTCLSCDPGESCYSGKCLTANIKLCSGSCTECSCGSVGSVNPPVCLNTTEGEPICAWNCFPSDCANSSIGCPSPDSPFCIRAEDNPCVQVNQAQCCSACQI